MPTPHPAEAVSAYLAGAGLGLTAGVNLFVGVPKAESTYIPSSAVFVLLSGGPAPEGYFNGKGDFIRSRVQVSVRSNPEDEEVGETLARGIAAALSHPNLGPAFVDCLAQDGEPIPLGRDEAGQYAWSINAEVHWRRP